MWPTRTPSRPNCQENETAKFTEFYERNYSQLLQGIFAEEALLDRAYQDNLDTETFNARADFRYEYKKNFVLTSREAVERFQLYCLEGVAQEKFLLFLSWSQQSLDKLWNTFHTRTGKEKLLEGFYAATICPYEKQNCKENERFGYYNGLRQEMLKTYDPEKLKYLWIAYHDAINEHVSAIYKEEFPKSKKPSPRQSYSGLNDYHRKGTSETPYEDAEDMISDILPFYRKLHAFARYRLKEKFPNLIELNGTIPAHFLRDIHTQLFTGISDMLMPYPEVQQQDVTAELLAQNWTVIKIAKTSENFFTSMGLPKLPDHFWESSRFEQTSNKPSGCHAVASHNHDMSKLMISMCGFVDERNLFTLHHEMGHIYYYIAYKNLPAPHRHSPNAAFHEGIGDTIYLSVITREYLEQIGLIRNQTDSQENEINNLMAQALHDIPNLPASWLYEKWRHDIRDRHMNDSDWNAYWWELKEVYQGIHPPEPRDDKLDPIAKWHLPAMYPYLRYFYATTMRYMLHESLCREINHTGPIAKCTIYGQKKAGEMLWRFMQLGRSKYWTEILQEFTGYNRFSAAPMMHYYEPLISWLDRYIAENNIPVGWEGERVQQ